VGDDEEAIGGGIEDIHGKLLSIDFHNNIDNIYILQSNWEVVCITKN
jgi:hypothetical protein